MKVMLMIMALFHVSTFANSVGLSDLFRAKGELRKELMSQQASGTQAAELYKTFTALNIKILIESEKLMPELASSSNKWSFIWTNQRELRNDSEMKQLFDQHIELNKKLDGILAKQHAAYKELLTKIDQRKNKSSDF